MVYYYSSLGKGNQSGFSWIWSLDELGFRISNFLGFFIFVFYLGGCEDREREPFSHFTNPRLCNCLRETVRRETSRRDLDSIPEGDDE